MSAAFLDYDNDGRLDIYTGNMWSAAGLAGDRRCPASSPTRPPEVRELYRRHARGNSLFRNRGDGTFEDVTLAARAEMGRWAWSSDALDFDSDGFEDLYVVNGMFTRAPGEADVDLDSFFWRQVTARLAPHPPPGHALRRRLARHQPPAGRERVAGAPRAQRAAPQRRPGRVRRGLGQRGPRPRPGRPLLRGPRLRPGRRRRPRGHGRPLRRRSSACSATTSRGRTPRSAPCASRGTKGNRDAVGARVTVETDRLRRTQCVQAGSGFISQHSKELLFGLGKSARIVKLEVRWPERARRRRSRDVPARPAVWIEEGKRRRPQPSLSAGAPRRWPPCSRPPRRALRPGRSPRHLALPALPGSGVHGCATSRGRSARSRALRGPPGAPPLLGDVALRRRVRALAGAGAAAPASSRRAGLLCRGRRSARGRGEGARRGAEGCGMPVLHGERGDGGHLLGPQPLPLRPARGPAPARRRSCSMRSRRDREGLPRPGRRRRDRGRRAAHRRRARPSAWRARVPVPGDLLRRARRAQLLPVQPRPRRAGLRARPPSPASSARRARPERDHLLQPRHALHEGRAARRRRARAFERALKLAPEPLRVSNSLGALLAQCGDVPGAIARFRAALEGQARLPRRAQQPRLRALPDGRTGQALRALPEGARAAARLPGGLQQPRASSSASRATSSRAEASLPAGPRAPSRATARPRNNLALVLAAKGDAAGATLVLQRLLEVAPEFEPAYVTLSRIYLQAGRRRDAVQVLELLLQRNPKNPAALEMLRQLRGGG